MVGLSACLLAQTAFAQSGVKVVFVSPQQLDVASLLPNPPANDSAQTTAELAELHRIQDTRSPAKIAHAKADDAEQDIFIFQEVLGKAFSRDLLPLTAMLSGHVRGNEGVMVNPAKTYFHRPRPYDFDPTLKPVSKPPQPGCRLFVSQRARRRRLSASDGSGHDAPRKTRCDSGPRR